MNWQPIETAPRDGTWVLLCGGDELNDSGRYWPKDPPMVVAHWGCPIDDSIEYGFDYYKADYWAVAYWDSAWFTEYENPTHWMPLPEPPK